MKPKFEVGEEVILQSKAYPEYNGEAVVLSVSQSNGAINREGVRQCKGGWKYKLTIESPVENRCWHELAIKKKQQKGDFSLQELMSNLNTKIQERV